MVALEPDNLKWRMESAVRRTQISASCCMNQRRFSEAAIQFASAIRPIEAVCVDRLRTTAHYQKALAEALGMVGGFAQGWEGRLDHCHRQRRAPVALLQSTAQPSAAATSDIVDKPDPRAPRAGRPLRRARRRPTWRRSNIRTSARTATLLLKAEPDNSDWKAMAASEGWSSQVSFWHAARRRKRAGSLPIRLQFGSGSFAQGIQRRPLAHVLSTACYGIAVAPGAGAGAERAGRCATCPTVDSRDRRQERSATGVGSLANAAAACGLLSDRAAQSGRSRATAWLAGLAVLARTTSEQAVVIERASADPEQAWADWMRRGSSGQRLVCDGLRDAVN